MSHVGSINSAKDVIKNAIQAGHLVRHLGAVALGKAARGNQKLVTALPGGQLAQRSKRLLLRWTDETTGVNNQNGGLSRSLDQTVAVAHQQLRHGVGVHVVLGTAERYQMERALSQLLGLRWLGLDWATKSAWV